MVTSVIGESEHGLGNDDASATQPPLPTLDLNERKRQLGLHVCAVDPLRARPLLRLHLCPLAGRVDRIAGSLLAASIANQSLMVEIFQE